jgi:ABC-type nitrate/sulfonate/bicarbonate transport system substrate-binding protein
MGEDLHRMKKFMMAGRISLLVILISLLYMGAQEDLSVASASGSNPFEGEGLKELKIAAEDWAYYAESQNLFEEAFGRYGIKVTIIQGTIGQESQLMARGDLHFAVRMLYPYLLYRSHGADMIAVQASTHPEPEIASVIVLKDSPVKTFVDLKGKKIASWRAGCPYMVLFERTEDEGWKIDQDWEYINIPPNNQNNALLSGEIDALSAHPLSELAPLLISGNAREVAYALEDGVYVNGGGITVTFSPSDFPKKYPKITKAYIALQEATEQKLLVNPDGAASIVESINRTPAKVSKFSWNRFKATYKSEFDLNKVKSETKAMQEWLLEHGDIENAVDVDTLFDARFFD